MFVPRGSDIYFCCTDFWEGENIVSGLVFVFAYDIVFDGLFDVVFVFFEVVSADDTH